MTALMVVLGLLMMSHVLYPIVPKFGFRNRRGILTGVALLSMIILSILVPSHFFFPMLMTYVAYGVVKALVLGFFERLPGGDPMLDEPGDEANAELREIDYDSLLPERLRPRGIRRRIRRPRKRKRPARPAARTETPRALEADGESKDSESERAPSSAAERWLKRRGGT
jgi:hypothetical protein